MSRRKVTLLAAATALLAALAGLELSCLAPASGLTIHLRCDDLAMGRLSISMLSEDGKSRDEKSFDVKAACRAGKVELERYRSEETLRVKIERGDGRAGELSVRYGPDIQRDRTGFFAVVRIENTPPFLANDSI